MSKQFLNLDLIIIHFCHGFTSLCQKYLEGNCTYVVNNLRGNNSNKSEINDDVNCNA